MPTGIGGLKERPEALENEKIGLRINNSFLTVQANYTFTEVATRVCMNPILKAEPEHGCLFERKRHMRIFFFTACLSFCIPLILQRCLCDVNANKDRVDGRSVVHSFYFRALHPPRKKVLNFRIMQLVKTVPTVISFNEDH